MAWVIASIPFWISGAAIVAVVLYAAWKDICGAHTGDDMLATAMGSSVLLLCGGAVLVLAAKIAS